MWRVICNKLRNLLDTDTETTDKVKNSTVKFTARAMPSEDVSQKIKISSRNDTESNAEGMI